MASNRGYDAVVDIDAEIRATSAIPTFTKTLNSTRQVIRSRKYLVCTSNFPGVCADFEDAPRSKVPSDSTFSSSSAINSKRYLWSLNFYAHFFDVDTTEVLNRCLAALYPRRPFLDVLDGNPDLYGPFWIATTVIFILFLSGTISQYLGEQGGNQFRYNIRLLSGALGLIYGYTFVVPVGLWAVLKWFGSEASNVLECWALYGYANLIWIPVALVSWSSLTILNWVFCAVGFAVSALFLVRNLWPVVSVADQKVSKVLVVAVVVLHAGLAVTIKQLFFAHGSWIPDKAGSGDHPSKR